MLQNAFDPCGNRVQFGNPDHWCPVNGVLIFEIMLFFIDKSRKRDVTDLNFLDRQML